MKNYYTIKLLLILVTFLSFNIITGCGKKGGAGKLIKTHTEGDVTVTIKGSRNYFKKGQNTFKLFFTKGGSPFDAGKDVKLSFYMPAMPPTMPEMNDNAVISPASNKGEYNGSAKLQMGQKWTVNILYANNKKISFDINAKE